MKLLLLTILLLGAVVRGDGRVTALGRARRNAEDRDLKGTSKTKSKSNIFHSKSGSQCSGMFLGHYINDPADASAECITALTSANQLACSKNPEGSCLNANTLGYTAGPLTNMCLAGQDTTLCYDLGGSVGQVTVQVKSAWDWSYYDAPDYCANILTKSVADPIALNPFVTSTTPNTDGTAGTCYDLSGFTLIDPGPTIDSTVTITVLSTGDSYIGEILPGGTVCEIHDETLTPTYTDVNKSKTFFEVNIDGQDYEGFTELDSLQSPPFTSTGRIVLYQV